MVGRGCSDISSQPFRDYLADLIFDYEVFRSKLHSVIICRIFTYHSVQKLPKRRVPSIYIINLLHSPTAFIGPSNLTHGKIGVPCLARIHLPIVQYTHRAARAVSVNFGDEAN